MKNVYVKRDIETRNMANEDFSVLMRGVLCQGNRFRFQAAGQSMFPLIRDGDILTLSPVNPDAVRLGDVLAFINPFNHKLLIHRVVSKKRGNFLIKADNSYKSDGWVSNECILGIVIKIDRGNKRIHLGLGREKWLIALSSRLNLIKSGIKIILFFYRMVNKRDSHYG